MDDQYSNKTLTLGKVDNIQLNNHRIRCPDIALFQKSFDNIKYHISELSYETTHIIRVCLFSWLHLLSPLSCILPIA